MLISNMDLKIVSSGFRQSKKSVADAHLSLHYTRKQAPLVRPLSDGGAQCRVGKAI